MERTRSCTLSVCLALLFSCVGTARGQQPDPAEVDPRQATLHQVLQLAQRQALDAKRVDWPTTTQEAQAILTDTPGEAGLTLAIGAVIKALGNRHTFYAPPRAARATSQAGSSDARPAIGSASRTASNLPMLTVRGWMGSDLDEASQRVRAALNAAMAEPSCGLLLDLRGNRGGNMWPMVWGVLPLLNPGKLGAFVDREGIASPIVKLPEGVSLGGHLDTRLPPGQGTQPPHLPTHIAVLQDGRTASSGEALTILFIGQDNARSFGQPSAGFTSSNRVFRLRNGGTLLLTHGRDQDRNGRIYDGALVPDVETDDAVAAATDWLMQACATRDTVAAP